MIAATTKDLEQSRQNGRPQITPADRCKDWAKNPEIAKLRKPGKASVCHPIRNGQVTFKIGGTFSGLLRLTARGNGTVCITNANHRIDHAIDASTLASLLEIKSKKGKSEDYCSLLLEDKMLRLALLREDLEKFLKEAGLTTEK